MAKLTLAEAKKKVAEAMAPPYLRIKFSYDMIIVLPYLKGIELLTVLAEAEKLEDDYRRPTLESLGESSITVEILSAAHRDQIKMSMLLDVDIVTLRNPQPPF